MYKWFKIFASGLVLLAILGFVAIHMVAPIAITQPPKVKSKLTPMDLGLKSDSLKIITTDSIALDAYWVSTEIDMAKGVIILIHGIGGCKEQYLFTARDLAEQGVETLLLDSRAHGKSEGAYCTYGYKEKHDIAAVIDSIVLRRPGSILGIWGNSLGGAIAIQALAMDERLDFGIVESTFTELDEIVFDYKRRLSKGLGLRFVADYVLGRAGQLADFDPDQVKPVESVKLIDVPMFIGHGDADEHIAVKYGIALYDNLKTTDKELYIVEGGGHNNLIRTGGQEYKDHIFSFIHRNLDSQQSQE